MLRWLSRLCILCLLSSLPCSAQSITGTWQHVRDSDGTTPTSGKTLLLTFYDNGKCHLQAVDSSGKQKTVTGDGTYSVRSGRIDLALPVAEINFVNRAYTVEGNALTLPFLLFNEGEGTSLWARAGGGPSPGPVGPVEPPPPVPPTPPDQRGDINQPAPPPPPPPENPGAGMNGELLCTCTEKAYNTPPQALKNCTRPSLGRPMCGVVLTTSKQPCSELQNTGGFKTLYDQVVLGRPGPLGGIGIPAVSAYNPKDPHTILIGTLISVFYKPWSPSDFYMSMSPGGKDDVEFAHVAELRPNQQSLVVRGAAFEGTPAALISIIGHETIHAEQLRRPKNKPPVGALDAITAAMNELEASSWETGESNFRWRIGPNKLWRCEDTAERDKAEAVKTCRAWQVRELLVEINKKHDTQQYFGQWIEDDPWAHTVWLPKNRGWRNITHGDPSSIIPYRHDPNHGIDCRQGLE